MRMLSKMLLGREEWLDNNTLDAGDLKKVELVVDAGVLKQVELVTATRGK